MELDVLIATYNRCDLLPRALASLLEAEAPPGLDVRVTVIDNNSSDGTRAVVEAWRERFGGRLNYIFEPKQGKGNALNAGIAAAAGDLIGMIDDDEEVEARWYQTIHEAFRDPSLDFIGGACLPRWGAPQPRWLPRSYPGVIGWIDGGDRVLTYGVDYEGILMGGNAVLRRSVFERVGTYASGLGPRGKKIMLGDDQDLFDRLMEAGVRGQYRPDLVILHYVPPSRLTKSYFRRWCFWNGVTLGVIDRQRPAPVKYLAGVPRWLYGKTARSVARMGRDALRADRDPSQFFAHELTVWDLAGFFYGKHFHKLS
ncbi:MAG TPA: glycosyltransferase family 2 protein [Pyrinomonadaceae bacterium]|jgi:glycosyltransferase involved in cell wall biosynthesis